MFFSMYPKNDLNVHDITSTKLKFVLSTNSSTRTFFFFPALILVVISMKLLSFGDDPLQGSDLKVSPPRGLPKITPQSSKRRPGLNKFTSPNFLVVIS